MAPAGRKTLETLGAADSIAEALEMAANERKRHEVSHMLLLTAKPPTYSCFSSALSLPGITVITGVPANARWLLAVCYPSSERLSRRQSVRLMLFMLPGHSVRI